MSDNCASVRLAPVGERDFELFSQWSSSSSWTYVSGKRDFFTPDEFKEMLRRTDNHFLMVRTMDGRTVGAVSWRTVDYPGSFEIGVMVGDAERWGSGYGMEAALLLLTYLFDSLNAHRVQFTCGVFNKLAVATFTSGLIRVEGVMRDYYFLDGTYQDAVFGSMLRDEYYNYMPPRESIAAAEKEEAIAMLHDYLAKNPVTLAMDRGRRNGE